MQIAVIQFPGSNCERETKLALQRAGMQGVDFLWNQAASDLAQFAGFVLVGGFSYEDRGRAGLLAAHDPIMKTLATEGAKGKPILGICNGAQILVESGLVPGLLHHALGMALTTNKRLQNNHVLGTGYYNTWCHVKNRTQDKNAFSRYLTPDNPINIPLAHAEGRFVIAPELLQELYASHASILHYCDAAGQIQHEFPINPNGSVDAIAAISNPNGNILALMPHPERTPKGDAIFHAMHDYIKEGYAPIPHTPLQYQAQQTTLQSYQCPLHSEEWLIELIITDNIANSVQNTLRQLGFDIHLQRLQHWEMNFAQAPLAKDIEKIHQSAELFNPSKESLTDLADDSIAKTFTLLVRERDDYLGTKKCEVLQQHFDLTTLTTLRHGIVWRVTVNEGDPQKVKQQLIAQALLHNPYAHDVYTYDSQQDKRE